MKKLLNLNLSVFYLLFLNINMFVVVSHFGQTFLFGTNLSFIFSAFCFLLFLITLNRIPISISVAYFILIIYSLAVTINGRDFYHWAISLFTLSTICLFGFVRIREEEYSIMFFISSLFSLCVIFLYTSIGFLGNWNPNSMSMFTTFGLLGFFIPFFLSNSNKKKMFYFTFILLSIYFVYLTDSRNNIMIFSILLFSILTYKINQRKILFRLYYIIAFLSPYIAGKAVSFISESKYYEAILVYSYKYFGKTSLTSGREQFWAYIEKLIGGNWLLGTGKSLYNIIYSHNIFYSVQYFFGAIGYFLYVVFIVFVLEYIYKNAKKDKISMGCVYLFIAIFFGQAAENALFTSDTSYYLPYVYLSIGIFRAKYIKINSKKTSMSKFYSPPKHENAAHG